MGVPPAQQRTYGRLARCLGRPLRRLTGVALAVLAILALVSASTAVRAAAPETSAGGATAPAASRETAATPAAPAPRSATPLGAPAPLPADKLQGTRLVDADANLSIDVPGPGWEWSMLTVPAGGLRSTYAVTNRELGKRFLVVVFEPALTSLPPSFLEGLLHGLPNHGAGIQFESVAVPAGGQRYRFTAESGGRTQHCVVYVVATGHAVAFQSCSPEAGDAPELAPWLASFRTLQPVTPAAAAEDRGARMGLQFLVVFPTVVGAGTMLNLVARRPLVNAWRLGGYAVVLLAGVTIASLFLRGRMAGGQGQLVGTILGSSVIPLILAVFGGNVVAKRRRRREATVRTRAR
jgi:hypothetical protein